MQAASTSPPVAGPAIHIHALTHSVVEWSFHAKTELDSSTLWVKKQDTKRLPITSPNVNRFSNVFTVGLGSKFATNSCLNIPPHLKHVAKLSCEIWMSETWRKSDICINDTSEGSIAKHLRCDELLYYIFFIVQSAGERTFKIGEHLAKLRVKCFMRFIRLVLLSAR